MSAGFEPSTACGEQIQFPGAGLVPKNETGVSNLLSTYPECDGRGILIAILDSAVDPSAAGLQKTSDGRVKIIDMIDATGSGDVDTSYVTKFPSDRSVIGLSGRQLKIPEDWQCPNGELHLGVKPLYDLYPERLRKRMQTEYREKEWSRPLAVALAECVSKQQQHASQCGSPIGESRLDKDDLDERVELLSALDKQFKDAGPCLDCVVFHDGDKWCACVDTSLAGELSQCQLMSDYRVSHQHGQLSPQCRLSYCCNIYSEGRLLSIVTPSSSHGTHVASIASAYFGAADSDKNGMAPGAQLVSINIGDARLGTMETGTSIARALAHLIRAAESGLYRVDLINMSYGEHCRWSDAGRLGPLANELVHRHGVLWCASAGNAGPALSTVGAPPNLPATLPSTIIGVGAYVTPTMMAACYGLRQPVPPLTPYTWTSRDPSSSSGGCYVTVSAPGCAITSVPNFTLQGCEQMNGTSMASPNACGSLAVLLSCLRRLQLNYSVYSVRRSIQATAVPLASPQVDCFAMGSGMLRVDRALENLRQHSRTICQAPSSPLAATTALDTAVDDTQVVYLPTVTPGEGHGIYIRDGYDVRSRVINKMVCIRCVFFNKEQADKSEMIAFEKRCALLCDCSWVQTARYIQLMNQTARSFAVRIDARSLPEGVHFTSIRGVDVSCPERGALFEVPVTVIVPCQPDATRHSHTNCVSKSTQSADERASSTTLQRSYTLHCGRVERWFIDVPLMATSCNVALQSTDAVGDHRYVLHALQCVGHCSGKMSDFYKMVVLSPSAVHRESFKITGGCILELALTKYWTSAGSSELVATVTLDGLQPVAAAAGGGCQKLQHQLLMCSSEIGRVDLVNYLTSSDICSPNVTLKHHVCSYRPASHSLTALLSDERDLLPLDRRVYALTLTYSFHVARSTDVLVQFKYLCDMLYESEFESQMWMLFDGNRQYITAGDAYPSKYSVKLDKGEYTVLLRVRHERKDVLEKLSDLSLQVSQKLASELKLDTYYKYNDVLTGQRRAVSCHVTQGRPLPLYIAPLPLSTNNSRSSKVTVSAGHQLAGHLSLVNSHAINEKVGHFPFSYIIANVGSKSSASAAADSKKTAAREDVKATSEDQSSVSSRHDEFTTALHELQISWLAKLPPSDEERASSLIAQLETSGGRCELLSALASRLQAFNANKESDAVSIVELADRIIELADRKSLLVFFGKKNVLHDDPKLKIEMEKEKSALLDALCRKGVALYECMQRKSPVQLYPLATSANIQDLMSSALELAEPTDAKLVQLSVRHALLHSRLGLAVRYQTRANDDVSVTSSEGERRLVELYQQLGWHFVSAHLQRTRPTRHPVNYRCF